MKSKSQGILILIVVAALCAGGAAWAGEEKELVWVGEDAHVMALPGHHGAKFLSEDGEVFDLADLRDGETRTFGEGAKQVTVTRDDEVVTIVRAESGEERKLEIQCEIGKDNCQVMTFAADPEKVMIIVKKTRTCIDGAGDCEAQIDVHVDDLDLGEGAHTIIRKVHCDDEGECEEFETVHGGTELEIIADVQADEHGNVIMLKTEETVAGKVALRCPEGDARIWVDKEEADQVFLCPKHAVPMEKSAPRKHHVHKIRVNEDDD